MTTPGTSQLDEAASTALAQIFRDWGLEALDIRTEVAVWVAALMAEQRKAERRKAADLLAEHAETLAAFAGDKADLVGLLSLLLRLDTEPAS